MNKLRQVLLALLLTTAWFTALGAAARDLDHDVAAVVTSSLGVKGVRPASQPAEPELPGVALQLTRQP